MCTLPLFGSGLRGAPVLKNGQRTSSSSLHPSTKLRSLISLSLSLSTLNIPRATISYSTHLYSPSKENGNYPFLILRIRFLSYAPSTMIWKHISRNHAWNSLRRTVSAYNSAKQSPLSALEQQTLGFSSSTRTIFSPSFRPSDASSNRIFGDYVEEFQRLCEVQSDKATIEITSRYKGKIAHILYVPGDIVKVGDTLLKIVTEEIQTPMPSHDALADTSSDSESSEPDDQCSLVNKEIVGVLSTPAVRHLAKQYGLNINDICGTGKDGRVLKEDVLKSAANKGLCKESFATSDSGLEGPSLLKEAKVDEQCYEDTTVLLRGFQRSMVKSMTMAAKVPHFHYLEEINCDALVELKAAFQNENTDQNVKHTYLPFLIKSLSVALCKHPLLNSSFNEESYELILKGNHNIGVAMATQYGLVVPNIKKVQSLSILEITKELSRLQQLALNNKLSTEDISGGTITLSNIGAIGGKFGSPLLNLPEVAIIAIGRIQKLPRFTDDGSVYPASVTNVTIGADHRVVDGATVARFCNEWKLLIEKPELLLLNSR
ncbi:lipoamide acyltransferase component of branched-chain alpha-keto acid dehydrogenase complex, mitochondrial isoform X2 [Magnolia sinica]|uniref:lipoamide acyltransferase component of branched-chain alpha-keto acid dehydrogenase complex, mitochondrial isoform X2 n=1 Tax=Magnolia sinica TaxID=86752 RepID=UPI002659F523|nr:lipoamide acyltransferase component of branched-chain alpha-keto acid dehydrogenase complex, mitochondrial isoform X2 [Magnolia sinica]